MTLLLGLVPAQAVMGAADTFRCTLSVLPGANWRCIARGNLFPLSCSDAGGVGASARSDYADFRHASRRGIDKDPIQPRRRGAARMSCGPASKHRQLVLTHLQFNGDALTYGNAMWAHTKIGQFLDHLLCGGIGQVAGQYDTAG
jgi:hypothetical protein